jgi:hypothetical protein
MVDEQLPMGGGPMEFGLFMEFPAPDGYTDQQTFQQGFTLVDEAESMGVDSACCFFR